MTSIAILTASQFCGRRLQTQLQAFKAVYSYLVLDEPDLSIRPLRDADIVIIDQDIPQERVKLVLRALGMISNRSSRVLLIVSPGKPADLMFEYLGLGAQAIVREDFSAADLVEALPQVAGGRLYFSPVLIPVVLECYRDLCARWRRAAGGQRSLPEMRLYR